MQNRTFIKRPRLFSSVLVAVAIGALAAASVQAQPSFFLNFDTVGQYTNNFFKFGTADNAESATAGVGTPASRGIDVIANNDFTAIYTNANWDFSTNGAVVFGSIIFKLKQPTSTGNKIQLGFETDFNNGLNGNAGIAWMSFRLIPSSTTPPITYSVRRQDKALVAGTATAETVIGTTSTMTAGRWYRFQITFTNISATTANTWSGSCSLIDYGTDGTTPGASVISFSTLQTFLNSATTTDSSVWLAFRTTDDNGCDFWDNMLGFAPNSAPFMTVLPASQTVPAGAAATFKSVADGPGTISYQWYSNNVAVSGATAANYTTPVTALSDSGTAYAVVASNANGSKTNGATLTVIVGPPTGLTATAGNTQVTLSWTAAAVATNYVIKRSTTSGGPYTNVATNNSTGYIDTGLVNGLTYFYVLSSLSINGESVNSTQASATLIPNAPATLSATPGDTQVTLAWAASTGATSYIVKRSLTMGGAYTPVKTNATISYVDTGLINLTPYFYVVSAVNAGGESPNSSEAAATPDAAPSGLAATGGTNQVSLSWNAFIGAVSYKVKRANNTGGPYTTIATGVVGASYVDMTAAGGTTYYYVVSADLGGPESANSIEASGTTAPSTLGGVSALAVTGLTQGGRQINVSWVTNNEVVTSIQIEQSTNGVDYALVGTVGGAVNTFSNANLATLSTYQYRVRAINGTGPSSYSAVVSATTTVNINFQIPTTVTPLGYLADTGVVFAVQQAGYSYGWDVDNSANARERLAGNSPDKRYDTLIHLQKQVPPRVFEIALPNGTYSVHMVAGDPQNFDSTFRLNLEGALALSGVPNNPNFWVESTSTVTVADGRLSLTVDPAAAGNTANNAKINFIDIAPVSAVAPTITAPPQSVTTIQGAATNFNVTTAGTLPQTYQWRHAGANIAGGANSGSIVGNNALSLANLRVPDTGDYDVVICNSAGCVTSSVVSLTFVQDFGDAPDTYKTTLANNGARHFILSGFNLGASVDAEADGFPSAGADGDDLNNSDDEDGVIFTAPVLLGQTVNITVVSSAVGKLDAWMDFDANGAFDPTDQIFTSQALAAGPNLLTFNVPASAVLGTTYARFRLSSAGGLGPDGPANDGEVEDYVVTILPASDLAIGKVGLPQMVDVNGGVTYTLLITNIGPSDATGVTVVDTLPGSVILGSAISSQGGCVPSGNTITCSLGGLVSGATATVTITVTTTVGGSITNVAIVSADQLDPRLANNTALAVNAVDRPPVAGTDTLGAISNRTATVLVAKLLSNDTDPDGDTLSITAVSATSTNGGTVSLGAGSVTYAPAANYVGADSFTYTASDGRGGSATGTVLVAVRSATDPSLNLIGGATISQNGVTIRFAGIPGRTYTVERSLDLITWTGLGTANVPAHGIGSFEDTSPPQGGAFYRIVYP